MDDEVESLGVNDNPLRAVPAMHGFIAHHPAPTRRLSTRQAGCRRKI
jgi:hypothetical protein